MSFHEQSLTSDLDLRSWGITWGFTVNVEPRLTVRSIQDTVADHYRIPRIEMVSARRGREVAFPRQVAMYLTRELTPKSLPDIGRRFRRDHTTVMYAINVVKQRMESDQDVARDVRALRERLSA